MARKNAILWFRKGLRLHDNPALHEACHNADHVYPVFIIDPFFLQSTGYKVSVNRYNFLLQSLEDLNNSFLKRGSRLLVLRGKPEEVLPRLFKDWDIQQLCFEVDTEPYAMRRDATVRELAAASGVQVAAFVSHTLYDTAELVRRNGGKAPVSMQSFTRLIDQVGEPAAPLPEPASPFPPPAPGAAGTSPDETHVPTWQEMGFQTPPTTIFQGGESAALARLEASLKDSKWVAGFEKPATDPSAFERPATTVLSPYLKFGCLSPRLFHQRLLQVYRQHKNHSQPPVSLRGQLLWREFFYTVGAATPNFDRMVGNPLCKQIGWDDNEQFLAAWKEGRTGYPWIDAIMTQLREWGWMHHLARHCVACFLTRGDLYVSWERGKDVFEELLIDQDHYLNAANWMWLSASGFFNQYFRVYSPVTFGKKYDPHGSFIRKFLPVLKSFPDKYIYEPWKAPLAVQRQANCIIGRDYPSPIVDHAIASKANMARMKAAYEANRGAAGQEEGGDEDPDTGAPAQPRGAAAPARRAAAQPATAASKRRKQGAAAVAGAAAAALQGGIIKHDGDGGAAATGALAAAGDLLAEASGRGSVEQDGNAAETGAANGGDLQPSGARGAGSRGRGKSGSSASTPTRSRRLAVEDTAGGSGTPGGGGRGKRQRTLVEMGIARKKDGAS